MRRTVRSYGPYNVIFYDHHGINIHGKPERWVDIVNVGAPGNPRISLPKWEWDTELRFHVPVNAARYLFQRESRQLDRKV